MSTAPRASAWKILTRRHPAAFLLFVQLSSLLAYPLVEGGSGERMLFGVLALVVVPLAVWTVSRSAFANTIAWALAVPAIALAVVATFSPQTRLHSAAALFESALYFYAAASLIVYMLSDRRVTADELFAAAAAFTLLAWGFAYAYHVCQVWYPDSFVGLEPERPRRWLELLSYSFTNLSATGIGDTLAVSAPARVLTMLEQFAGVGYVAAVVSRLIGLTLPASTAPGRERR